jgi:hypothetical protein
MIVLFHPPSPSDAGMFDAPDDDPGLAPWIHLRNRFRDRGIAVDTSYRYQGRIEEASRIVFMNIPVELAFSRASFKARLRGLLRPNKEDSFYKRCVRAKMADRMAVILWEPHVVYPENYVERAHRKFAHILSWSERLLAESGRYHPIVWPQPPVIEIPENPPFSDRKLLCNFSGNKTSTDVRELYSARVEVIRFMESRYPEAFDHYGPGWEGDYPSWRGTVESKFTVYPRYRFGLCYENMQNEPGYITEKIFDCLRAGCVPIYLGAPDILERIPGEAFVDRRQFADTAGLIEYLSAMPKAEWMAMRKAGWDYLHSEGFKRYQPESFFQMLRAGLDIGG